jgi:hypothetical protein
MVTRATFSEHDGEPVHGLPAALPPGEKVFWQGSPAWLSLALDAYRVRLLAIYFGSIVLARGGWLLWNGSTLPEALRGCIGPALMSAVCLMIVVGIATLAARATVYTITNRRIVIRQGVALESTVNLPFKAIESANLLMRSDETGDIALQTMRDQRVSYLWLWPHVRPWRITRPQPTLRNIAEPRQVAEILARAVTDAQPDASMTVEASFEGSHTLTRPDGRPLEASA